MAALLVVDRTMVRSLGASAQRVVAVVVGMSAAWLVGSVVGVHWWTCCRSSTSPCSSHAGVASVTTASRCPTMVLLSLLTVGGTDMEFTYLTIVETLAGGVIGVLTNAIVLAPLHIQQPREQIRALTAQVCQLLNDIAAGLREGWDSDTAREWYDTSTELIHLAPDIQAEIETGRESTRFNPRDNLRGLEIDWTGYAQTVEAVRRSQWQVSGIARTLVDAADEDESQPRPPSSSSSATPRSSTRSPAPSPLRPLRGRRARGRVATTSARPSEIIDDLGDEVREAELEDPQRVAGLRLAAARRPAPHPRARGARPPGGHAHRQRPDPQARAQDRRHTLIRTAARSDGR